MSNSDGISRPGISLPQHMVDEVNRSKLLIERAAKEEQQRNIHDPITQAHWMPEAGKVQRELGDKDTAKKIAHVTRAVADQVKPTPHCKYVGTMAVHVYHSAALEQMLYVESYVPSLDGPVGWELGTYQKIFGMALETLGGYMKGVFSGRRTGRRSGF